MNKIPPPNYTQIPNVVLDDYLPAMTEAELKVTLIIARQTFGWHREKATLSLSTLVTMTGLSRQGVINGINSGLNRGTINRSERGQGYEYGMEIDAELVNEVDHNQSKILTSTSQNSGLVLVNEVDHIKERKERKEKSSSSSGQSPKTNGAKKPDMNNLPQPPTLGEINGLWMANIGAIGPIQAEMIADLYTDYGGFEMEVAIKAAVTANARNMNYVQGTLKGRRNGSTNHPSQQTARNGSGRPAKTNGTGRATQPTLSDEDARLMAEWAAANT